MQVEILSNVVDEIFSGSIVEPLRGLFYSFHPPRGPWDSPASKALFAEKIACNGTSDLASAGGCLKSPRHLAGIEEPRRRAPEGLARPFTP